MPIFQLSERIEFPPPHLARTDGLLAVGGDLSLKRLLLAYTLGIFPWYADGQPILWWSPDPRLVLRPGELKVSKSLRKRIRRNDFRTTMDTAFGEVIRACAMVRLENNEATWLDEGMIAAYCRMHEAGFAHSVEAWQDGTLAGGLYGVSLGGCFFGESMFTRVSDASKVAFVFLVRHLENRQFDMIDCQVSTEHLLHFGAREIPRRAFLKTLHRSLEREALAGKWPMAES